MDWNVQNLRGRPDDLARLLSSKEPLPGAKKPLPDFIREFIRAELQDLPRDCFAAKVDAYGVSHEHAAGHGITRSIVVTVVAMK